MYIHIVLPPPSSAPIRGAAKVFWLLILWHKTAVCCFIFYFFCSLCYAFSARHFSRPSGTVGSVAFPFRVGFRFLRLPLTRWRSAGGFSRWFPLP